MAAGVENPEIARDLILTLGGRQSGDGYAHSFLGTVSKELFGGAIPAGDRTVRTDAEDGVGGIFDDGGHLTGAAVGSRFGERPLTSHAAREHGNSEEYDQALQIGGPGSYQRKTMGGNTKKSRQAAESSEQKIAGPKPRKRAVKSTATRKRA